MVDRLFKYGQFIPIKHPYLAPKIAKVFIQEFFRLHGISTFIVSDRDLIFINEFWIAFFKQQHTIDLTSSYTTR